MPQCHHRITVLFCTSARHSVLEREHWPLHSVLLQGLSAGLCWCWADTSHFKTQEQIPARCALTGWMLLCLEFLLSCHCGCSHRSSCSCDNSRGLQSDGPLHHWPLTFLEVAWHSQSQTKIVFLRFSSGHDRNISSVHDDRFEIILFVQLPLHILSALVFWNLHYCLPINPLLMHKCWTQSLPCSRLGLIWLLYRQNCHVFFHFFILNN